MRLYDKDILACKKLLEERASRRLPTVKSWRCTDQEALVLRSDMAYELGGGTKAAVSGLGFTTDSDLVPESGVFLIGPDLPEIREDVSCARITLLRLEGVEGLESQQLYSVFRKLEYTRYHIYPEGYMMRISTVKEREPVRISKASLKEGMDFAGVGACFAEQYAGDPWVKAVQTYFVTDPGADYGALQKCARRFEQITESMNLVFQGFSMDCSTCGQRELCEEIDGLKELHKSMDCPCIG
ncbi:MAG: carbon monoxide dehydrogenase [Acetatifactor sp.]|nr:carbon monoxide dehydrogenase [Acetatifactor sp.]